MLFCRILVRNFKSNCIYLYRKDMVGDHAVNDGRDVSIVYFVARLAKFTRVEHV